MIRIYITREHIGKTCCIGTLRILENGEPVFQCKTLEEEIESNKRGQDHRIPTGEYKCFWHENSRFKDRLTRLLGWTQEPLGVYNDEVSGDRFILFHSGNTHKDTEGCILLGTAVGQDGESIVNSNIAVKAFYEVLNRRNSREITVEITNDQHLNI